MAAPPAADDAEANLGIPGVGGGSQRARSRRRNNAGGKDVGMHGQASFMSSVINLLNTIVGAGVLAMPLAMAHMGMLLGTIVIVWAGITAGFGLYLQTLCARYLERGTSSFFALSQLTYPNMAVVFDAAIAVKCFGVAVSYLIIIGDLMPGVVRGFNESYEELPFLVDRHFWITGFMLVVIPLSFLRRLDSLKYTSVVALISIGYLVILVLAHFIKGDTGRPHEGIRFLQWGGFIPALSSFPVIIFAYTCHQNMFSILNEIADNSLFRTTGVVLTSNGISCSLYVLVAITGYLSFGNDVAGNIVSMYPSSTAATIAKAAIVVLVMFSYPLQVHPCRASVDAVLKWRWKRNPENGPNASPSRNALLAGTRAAKARTDVMSDTRFALITTVIIVLSYVVAMTVSSLSRVLAYVGSTGSTSISFILPGLFYYKISSPDSALHQKLMKEDDDEGDGEEREGLLAGAGADAETPLARITGILGGAAWRKGLTRRLALALSIYGMVVMVVCLVTNTLFVAGH